MILTRRPARSAILLGRLSPADCAPAHAEQALATLQRAAMRGWSTRSATAAKGYGTSALLHLRVWHSAGHVDLGLQNVVAPSAFVNRADTELCIACGACVSAVPSAR
jgi:hypothetical protein